jgi:hypothetical protein
MDPQHTRNMLRLTFKLESARTLVAKTRSVWLDLYMTIRETYMFDIDDINRLIFSALTSR